MIRVYSMRQCCLNKATTEPEMEREQAIQFLTDLVRFNAQALVDDPRGVEVTTFRGEQTTVIYLKVPKAEVGKVIGKQGKTANALRELLKCVSTKLRMRAVMEIQE